jgi:hypothetical protein
MHFCLYKIGEFLTNKETSSAVFIQFLAYGIHAAQIKDKPSYKTTSLKSRYNTPTVSLNVRTGIEVKIFII